MAVTFTALTCGFASLEATRNGVWGMALRLIVIAAVADGIDGTIARRLHAAGQMGKELDSLSDVIAFGAAPAFLTVARYAAVLGPMHPAMLACAAIFVGAGAYRLARFQTESRSEMFSGLPITAAGVILAATVAGPFSQSASQAAVVMLVLAVLMVSRVPFPTFSQWRRALLAVMAIAVVPIVVWPQGNTVAVVALALLGLYVAWGLTSRLVGDKDVGAEVALDVS